MSLEFPPHKRGSRGLRRTNDISQARFSGSSLKRRTNLQLKTLKFITFQWMYCRSTHDIERIKPFTSADLCWFCLVLYSRLSRILCTSMSMEMSNLSSSALAADTASSSPWFSCTSGARILHSIFFFTGAIFIKVPATCGCDTLGLFHYLS